ncbi:hypothetical protein Lalb_Chr09g0331861 [Lupinus albus]|uniref:Uncharacterized protein n=1 Tax=Lupinus albus TaxID=3870 RepID=A0A6A4Q1F5_LUPAL|nr:hypothetical protein Lalb_Chr09g0331861 [Lupinus albus]
MHLPLKLFTFFSIFTIYGFCINRNLIFLISEMLDFTLFATTYYKYTNIWYVANIQEGCIIYSPGTTFGGCLCRLVEVRLRYLRLHVPS